MNEENSQQNKSYAVPVSVLLAAAILAGAMIYTSNNKKNQSGSTAPQNQTASSASEEQNILPADGVVLPVKWNDLGKKMISVGVIDSQKFEALYAGRGGMSEEMKKLLYGSVNGNLKITKDNSNEILNLLWALGLGNKNAILDAGEMRNPQYGGAGNFASTGGWTMSKGDAMGHYSMHPFIILTQEQQDLVDRVSKGIYRPCCGNSTHFPDCNHGMAMLGLLELMASQGVNEEEMYRAALAVNSYWFPDNYATIAKYFSQKGVSWDKVNAQEVLGVNFSSSSGYQRVLSEIGPVENKGGGGGCSV